MATNEGATPVDVDRDVETKSAEMPEWQVARGDYWWLKDVYPEPNLVEVTAALDHDDKYFGEALIWARDLGDCNADPEQGRQFHNQILTHVPQIASHMAEDPAPMFSKYAEVVLGLLESADGVDQEAGFKVLAESLKSNSSPERYAATLALINQRISVGFERIQDPNLTDEAIKNIGTTMYSLMNILEGSQDKLEALINSGEGLDSDTKFTLYNTEVYLAYYSQKGGDQALEVLRDHLKTFAQYTFLDRSPNSFYVLAELFRSPKANTEEQLATVREVFKRFVDKASIPYQMDLLDKLDQQRALDLAYLCREEVVGVPLRKAGLDPEKLQTVWHDCSAATSEHNENFKYEQVLTENLLAIKALEANLPGSCKTLQEEFGIVNFGRYPVFLLARRYLTRNEDHPYGVIIYPKTDHNGAFYEHKPTIDSLNDQLIHLDPNFVTRVVEAETKDEVNSRLLAMHRRYYATPKTTGGTSNKITFAMIGGHGNPEGIQFGSKIENGRYVYDNLLASSDVAAATKGGVTWPKNIYVPNPTIILASCSTGRDQGVGDHLAELTGATVLAPTKDAYLEAITVSQIDGHLNFEVSQKEPPVGTVNVTRRITTATKQTTKSP